MKTKACCPGPRNAAVYRRKLVFSVVAVGCFFVILEGTLALVGVVPVTQHHDPFVGFASQLPLTEIATSANGKPVVVTAANKLVWFNAQSFPLEKPDKTQRVFCVGGSTTYGRPYRDATSYCGWLRELLPLVDDKHTWEVINAGGVSYASYRVAEVMQELAQYEPDLFIVYTGHNEFLERRTYANVFDSSPLQLRVNSTLSHTRVWALLDRVLTGKRAAAVAPLVELPAEVDEILNHTVGPTDYERDDAWRADVLRHCQSNLARMVSIAREANAGILFVVPASNEMDTAPFKSESLPLGDDGLGKFWSHFEAAELHSEAGRPDEALVAYERAITLDARHAHLHYRTGQLLFQMGKTADAREAFQRALNEDVCPLRATAEICDSVRQLANESDVTVVDFDHQLRAQCEQEHGHRCLGNDYFLDHVHPTIEVHRQLALWILDALQTDEWLEKRALTGDDVDEVAHRIYRRIDREELGRARRNLAKVLHWAGRFPDAAAHARAALEVMNDDPESLFILGDCLWNTGHDLEALGCFERLLDVAPDYRRGYVPCGMLLAEQGRFAEAKICLALGLVMNPENPAGHSALGAVHMRLDEFDLAVESLEHANRLKPNDPNTLLELARAQIALANTTEAIGLLHQVLAANPNEARAHFEMARVSQILGQMADAERHFQKTIELDSENEIARQLLEEVRAGAPSP